MRGLGEKFLELGLEPFDLLLLRADDTDELGDQLAGFVEGLGLGDDGVVALVRLRSRDGGVIPPDDFLSAVRKAPLGRELDRRVLERSIEGLARWRRAGVVDARFTLSVNVTGASLRDPELGEELAAALARHRVPPACLVIEISEKTGDFDMQVLRGLRDTGVRIALDDVGLHRSNLDRLVSVNPEIAKIDRQWLDDEVVLPRLVDLCRSLGFTLVAEGIETEAQLARLQGLQVPEVISCDRVTGEDCFIARVCVRSVQDLESVLDRIVPLAMTHSAIVQSSPVAPRLPPVLAAADPSESRPGG